MSVELSIIRGVVEKKQHPLKALLDVVLIKTMTTFATPIHELIHVILAILRGDKVVKVDWFGGETVIIPRKKLSLFDLATEEAIAELGKTLFLYPVMRKAGVREESLNLYLALVPFISFIYGLILYGLIEKRKVKQ